MTAIAKRIFKTKQMEKWENFMNSLTKDTPTKKILPQINIIDKGITQILSYNTTSSPDTTENFLIKLTPSSVENNIKYTKNYEKN